MRIQFVHRDQWDQNEENPGPFQTVPEPGPEPGPVPEPVPYPEGDDNPVPLLRMNPRRNPEPEPNPGPTDPYVPHIVIHPESPVGDPNMELSRLTAENTMIKNENERFHGRITELEAELEQKEREIRSLTDRLRDSEGGDQTVSADDLADKDSLIAELRFENEALRRRLEGDPQAASRPAAEATAEDPHARRPMDGSRTEESPELATLRQEHEALKQSFEELRQQKEASQSALASFMARENVTVLPQCIAYADPTPEQAEAMRRYEAVANELNRETGSFAVVNAKIEELREEVQSHLEEVRALKQQSAEAEEEKGQAYEELREIWNRRNQDMKYVAFYEKVPEKKIDGLELFRSKIRKIDGELTELLDQGMKKAYVFRGSDLIQALEQNRTEQAAILEQLADLVENYEFEEAVCEAQSDADLRSTEALKIEAQDKLKELEKTLRQMREVSEKFLKIKNMIGFDYD